MTIGKKVLIVGGVAGGATAAARLRRLDEKAEIIMFEKGAYISYANCGLPYYIGGDISDPNALTLQTPQSFNARFNVDVRILSEVTVIHPQAKSVLVTNHENGTSYTETYDHLILSMGAEPFRPGIEGIDSDRVFTLRTIPDTFKIKNFINDSKPRSAVVIGGGFIGVEMAENLTQAGLSVTLVEMMDQVIPPIDYDMACEVHRHLESSGVRLKLGNGLRSISDQGSSLKIYLDNDTIEADMLIMAIGVRPDTGLAKAAGLALNERGCIVVDEHMQTSEKDIFAVGDAVEITDFVTGNKGFVALAGPANKQARVVADNICGIDSIYTGTQGSSILKVFDLTVASTGVSEKTAKRLGLDYDKIFTFSSSHAGYYPGATSMRIKTIFDKNTGKILGAQLVGKDGVDKRCDVLATAIRAGMTATDLTRLELCYAPPYSSAKDPVNMIGFAIENVITGKVKNFHWHDVATLQQDSRVTLLDIRTTAEYEAGHIDGFINIPLDSLRDRLDELDKQKPIYETCMVGARGYVAARILMQNGFDVYNFNGGYLLYRSIFAPHED